MIKKMIIASSILALSSLSLSANAHPKGEKPTPFHVFDKDSSGFISEEELHTTRNERMAKSGVEWKTKDGLDKNPLVFSNFDSNNDGKINKAELEAGLKARHQHRPH